FWRLSISYPRKPAPIPNERCVGHLHFLSLKFLLLLSQPRRAVPRNTSTAYPPTRTFVIRSPSRVARTYISLGRRIPTPCRITTCSSLSAMPRCTIQLAAQPAADPVAGSSPP